MSNSFLTRALKAALNRFAGTSIYKFHYLTLDVTNRPKTYTELPFVVKELTLEDFKTGNPQNFTQGKIRVIKSRLNSNDYKAFGIIENGKLVYSTWVGLNQITLPNGDVLPLSDDEAILEDSYCEPSARGRHFHSVMNRYRLDYLASIGKKIVIAIVLDGNAPAMKVQLKSGFTEQKTFRSGRFFWKKFSTLSKQK